MFSCPFTCHLLLKYLCHPKWSHQRHLFPLCSEKLEKINDLLKRHLRELTEKTHLPWSVLPPMGLLRIRNTPQTLGPSPYEMLYGCSFLTNDLVLDSESSEQIKDIIALAKFQQTYNSYLEHFTGRLAYHRRLSVSQVPGTPHNTSRAYLDWALRCNSITTTVNTTWIDSWIHHSSVKLWRKTLDTEV
jgi:hypothetical protein